MPRGHRPAPCRTRAARMSTAQQRLERAHRNGATHPGRALLASLWPHAHGHSDARVVVVRHGRLPQRTRSAGLSCFARARALGPARVPARNSTPRESQPLPARFRTVDLSLTEMGQLLRSSQRQARHTSRPLKDRPYARAHTHTHPPPPAAYSCSPLGCRSDTGRDTGRVHFYHRVVSHVYDHSFVIGPAVINTHTTG